jgi:hypothetical protein
MNDVRVEHFANAIRVENPDAEIGFGRHTIVVAYTKDVVSPKEIAGLCLAAIAAGEQRDISADRTLFHLQLGLRRNGWDKVK